MPSFSAWNFTHGSVFAECVELLNALSGLIDSDWISLAVDTANSNWNSGRRRWEASTCLAVFDGYRKLLYYGGVHLTKSRCYGSASWRVQHYLLWRLLWPSSLVVRSAAYHDFKLFDFANEFWRQSSWHAYTRALACKASPEIFVSKKKVGKFGGSVAWLINC